VVATEMCGSSTVQRLFVTSLSCIRIPTRHSLGHVRFITPDDDLEASRMDFDLNHGAGVLYDTTGKRQGLSPLGERVERWNAHPGSPARRITPARVLYQSGNFAPEAQLNLGDTSMRSVFWIRPPVRNSHLVQHSCRW